MRRVVLGGDHARGGFQRRIRIAVVALDLAGLAHILFQHRAIGLRVVGLVRPVVPDDLQGFAALQGRPGVLRHHGDAAERVELRGRGRAVELHHLLDARHLQRLGRIERHDLAADHRRTRHHGELHAVEHHILPVGCLAGRDVRQVDQRHVALADVAERGRLLELHVGLRRHRERRRIRRDLAVAELASARAVHDLVVLRHAFGRVDAPPLRRRLLQHRPGGRAAQAHRLDEMPDTARAIGVLVAVFHLVAFRLPDADFGPVGVELVGNDHRQGRARRTRAHLGTRRDDRHGAVRRDRHEYLRVAHGLVRHRLGAGRIERRRSERGVLRGEHEAAARGEALQQAAPAHIGDHWRIARVMIIHVTLPSRRRARPHECADSSRSGRDCRTSHR